MTIRIKVTNEDSRESAVVGVQLTFDGKTQESVVELKGGESHETYVHSSQQVLVKEISQ